jgi:hypothetical protein
MLTLLFSFLSPLSNQNEESPTPARSFSKRRFGIIPKNPYQVSSMQTAFVQGQCG